MEKEKLRQSLYIFQCIILSSIKMDHVIYINHIVSARLFFYYKLLIFSFNL